MCAVRIAQRPNSFERRYVDAATTRRVAAAGGLQHCLYDANIPNTSNHLLDALLRAVGNRNK